MSFFNNKNNSKAYFNFKIGSSFEYSNKIWTVKKIFQYDWGEYKSIEYEVESLGEKAFLDIEQDDEMFMTFTNEIEMYKLENKLADKIKANEIPDKITYKYNEFIFDEASEGTCLDLQTKEKDNVYCIDFYDENDKFLISVEQWDEDEFTASYGKVIKKEDIIINENSNLRNRFI